MLAQGLARPSFPSATGRRAAGADDELAVDERLAAVAAGEERERAATLARRGRATGDELREGAVHRVGDAVAGDPAHRRRAGHDDVGDGAGLRDHGDRPERSGRAGDVDLAGRHDGLVDARLDERRRAVERAAHHRRRVGEVGGELVAARSVRCDGDRHVEHVDPVGVHVVGEGRGAVGPARDLLPQQLLGVVEQPVHQRGRAGRRRSARRAPAGRARRSCTLRPGR